MPLPININDLIGGKSVECKRIEYKEGWNPSSIYRSICAFANDFDNEGGGFIIIGVKEDGNGRVERPVKGLDINQLDKIQKEMVNFNNLIQPYYSPRNYIEDVDSEKIMVIWVTAGDKRPYKVPDDVTSKYKNYNYYIRYNSSSIVAKGDNELELINLANRVPFDDRGNLQATSHDISKVLLRDYLIEADSRLADSVESESVENILDQLQLMTYPRESRHIKNAALMLFSNNPERFFPRTQVDIVIYPRGKNNSPKDFIEIPPIKGPIHHIIRKSLDVLQSFVKKRVKKIHNQAEAKTTFNYPFLAIEEAVVNALYHRSYDEREPVEICILPDRIEIISYNGPDRSINLEALRAGKSVRARRYRNSRLGDFLKDMHLTEGRGTGIPTIHDELKKNGSPAAIFEADNDRTYFLVTIPCHPEFVVDEIQITHDTNNVDTSSASRHVLEVVLEDKEKLQNYTVNDGNHTVNDGNHTVNGGNHTVKSGKRERTTNLILKLLSEKPYITISEICNELGKSRPTINEHIAALKLLGRLRRVGSDKTGHWEVINK